MYFIKDFYYRVINVIRWIPTIWKDNDWDHAFLYKILRKKISHMEKYFRIDGHHLNSDKEADQMKVTVNILDRLINDDYLSNALKPHKEKWGEMEFKFNKCEDSNLSTLEFIYEKANTEKEKKQCRKEFKLAGDHSEYMLNQDLEYLLKLFRKYIRHWWD